MNHLIIQADQGKQRINKNVSGDGAHNTFQDPERVKPTAFTEIQFNREKVTTVLPPMSVCTLTVQVRL